MVDLTIPSDKYDQAYFEEIEAEMVLYPHFLVLQSKYVEVGDELNIQSTTFLDFKNQWKKAQELIYECEDNANTEPPCSNLEKKELLSRFLSLKNLPSSPRGVFSNF